MPDYTSATEIDQLAGQVGVDLRTDDGTESTLVAEAIDYAAGDVDYYCQGRFSNLDTIQYVRNAATHFAVEWLSLRRLNSVTESLQKACDRYREQLTRVLEGKAIIPGATRSRRQAAVSNYNVDLRKFNNTIRTDRSRSTGVAKDYRRPVDPTAPDQR